MVDELTENSNEQESQTTAKKVRAGLIVCLLVFALIFAGGMGYAMRDPTQQPEYAQMVADKDAQIKSLKGQIDDQTSRNAELWNRIKDLTPYKDQYDKKQQELTKQASSLNSQKAAQEKKQKELDDKSAQLDQRSKELDARESSIQQQAPVPAPTAESQTSEPSQSASPTTGGSVYYKNCKAVWNALGHGITSNDPGYSTDLDADGDGYACERRPNY